MSRLNAKVSVGLPVYNGAEFLREALDSICNQTYENLEIVISDNASTDETAEICREYMARDSRIHYFRQPQILRPADNHNFVFDRSTGTYFRWACHDDCSDPTYISRCVEALESQSSAIIAYSKARLIDPAGSTVLHYDFPVATDAERVWKRYGAILRADSRRYQCLEIYGVIRSAALKWAGPMGSYVHGDRVYLTRLLMLGTFVRIPEFLFYSREHSSRSSRVLPSRIVSGRTRLWRWIGVGPLPALEWWDPSKKGMIHFPEWRAMRENLSSVLRAPLGFYGKFRCLLELARWAVANMPKLGRDLIMAAEQFLVGSPASPKSAKKQSI